MGRVRRMCPGWLGRGQRGPGLDLHSLFCSIHLPPVHQGLQGRQHGPGAVSVVPLGLDRRRLLQPHRLLPGRPAAPAGGSRGGWGVRVGGSWQEHPAPDHCSCRAALVHTLSGPVARLQNEHIKPEGASGVLGTPLSCQGWGGPGGGKVCLRGAGWQVPGTTGRHRIFPAGKASAGTLSSPLSPICPAEARPPPPSVRAVRALRVLRGRGPRRGPRRSGRRGRGSGRLLRAWCPEPRFPQTYTAVYYVLADLLMLSLYFHYKFKKRPSALSAPINAALLVSSGVACGTPLLRRAGPEAAPAEVFRGRTLLSVEPGSKVSGGCVTWRLGPRRPRVGLPPAREPDGTAHPGPSWALSTPALSALHSAGNHRLRHRLRVQRVVPAVAAASDPHQREPGQGRGGLGHLVLCVQKARAQLGRAGRGRLPRASVSASGTGAQRQVRGGSACSPPRGGGSGGGTARGSEGQPGSRGPGPGGGSADAGRGPTAGSQLGRTV
uniref:Uncharacterized protein n=1 Tax=Canis lupus dingo TaxID=286419 RepID=A0A8C0K5V0_CANLU